MTFGRHWIRHWIAVAAVVPLLLLGACSQDDPEPTFSPPSDSPSATESSPTEPVVRPWEKKTEAGAVAFAKHWIDVFNAAQADGETSELRSLSSDSCGTCDGFSKQLEDLYGAGGRLETKGWAVTQAVPTKDLPSHQGRVTMRVTRTAQVVVSGDGSRERFAASEVTLSARLLWVDDRWTMNDLIGVG